MLQLHVTHNISILPIINKLRSLWWDHSALHLWIPIRISFHFSHIASPNMYWAACTGNSKPTTIRWTTIARLNTTQRDNTISTSAYLQPASYHKCHEFTIGYNNRFNSTSNPVKTIASSSTDYVVSLQPKPYLRSIKIHSHHICPSLSKNQTSPARTPVVSTQLSHPRSRGTLDQPFSQISSEIFSRYYP